MTQSLILEDILTHPRNAITNFVNLLLKMRPRVKFFITDGRLKAE